MMYFLILLLVEGAFVSRTISQVMWLIITSVASNIGRISSVLSFVMMVLPFVVMVILLVSLIYSGVNCERLILNCSHVLFSYYELRFFFCTFFPESTKVDRTSFGT